MIDFITNIDKEILYFIQEFLRYNFLNGIFSFITKLGNGGFIWILITIILLIPKKTRKVGILSLCSLLLCHVVNNLSVNLPKSEGSASITRKKSVNNIFASKIKLDRKSVV